MKKSLLITLAIFAVFYFLPGLIGIWLTLLLSLLFVAYLLWSKRASIVTNFASRDYFVKGDKESAYRKYKYAYKTGLMTPANKISFAAFFLYIDELEKSRRLLDAIANSSRVSENDRANALHYISILDWKEGDLDGAASNMEKVHEMTPSTGTYGTLGAFYVEKAKRDGDFHTYLDFLTEAYDYNGADRTIADNLGELYLLSGEYVKAEEIYNQLFSSEQDSPVPYYHFGLVLKELGKTDDAKSNFEKALTLNFARSLTVSRSMVTEALESL